MIGMLLLLSCAEGPADDSASGFCDDQPTVTYESFGAGFFTQYCQPCHGSGSENRQGAPDDVIYDTVGDIWQRAERILERATGENRTMPPVAGVHEVDRQRLEIWLTCAEPGT